MSILITGGTGFIGAEIVRELLARGEEEIHVLHRSGNLQRLQDLVPRLHLVQVELADGARLQEVVEETLGRLNQVGLLDDLAFARYWVENRFQFRPRGLIALRQELRQKSVDEAIIEEVLPEYDEEEAAARAGEGRKSQYFPTSLMISLWMLW